MNSQGDSPGQPISATLEASALEKSVSETISGGQILLMISMYLGYAGFMLMKTSIVAAGPALLSDSTLGLTKADWGMILGWGTMGGIIGKFISGFSADRWGGKIIFTSGLVITTLGISNFSFRAQTIAFAATYFIILMSNSSGWPSMAKLIGHWFQPNQFGRVWGLISTSSRVGTITATIAVGGLLKHLDWRHMLWVSASIGATLALLFGFLVREKPSIGRPQSQINTHKSTPNDSHVHHPFSQMTLKQAFFRFFRSRRFLLIGGSMMALTVLWDFLNFVPIYLNENLKLSSADAASATASFPIGSLISVLMAGFFFDKLSRNSITKIIGIYLALAIASLLLIANLSSLNLTEQQKITATLFCLFVFGFTVSPAYYLPMSIFAIDFGGPHSGFLIALIDAIGYSASIAFSVVGGRLLMSDNGWSNFFALLISVALGGWLLTVLFLRGEAKHHQ